MHAHGQVCVGVGAGSCWVSCGGGGGAVVGWFLCYLVCCYLVRGCWARLRLLQCILPGSCGCGTSFCYVCGGDTNDCPRSNDGCDRCGVYMEEHAAWERFGSGQSCLVEFHRRKTNALLQLARHLIGEPHWVALRRASPELLATGIR